MPHRGVACSFVTIVIAGMHLAGAAATPARAASSCAHADSRPSKAKPDALARAALCLVNAERRAHGLRRLVGNVKLARGALRHASDMARRDYYAHVTPEGDGVVDRLRRVGYVRLERRWRVGENLCWFTEGRATPRSVIQAWLSSWSHRRNILDRGFREIGIAVVEDVPVSGRRGGATYVADFGARR